MWKQAIWIMASTMSFSVHANLVINEVDSDNPSTDTSEFIELFDGGAGSTSLNGYVLVLFNGNGDTSYKSIDLTGYTTDANGYFVVCGNASNVANCDLDVSPDSNLVQNGADAVALYFDSAASFPSGSDITTTNLIDAIVYDTNDSDDTGLLTLLNSGQPQVNEGGAGDKDNHSNQRCGEAVPLQTDGYIQANPTPGEANNCDVVEPDPFGSCGERDTNGYAFIHQIQGDIIDVTNDQSPMKGQTVIVEAVVTMDLQGGTLANGDSSYQYSGYWLQEETEDQDSNANTSEGIFVYDYRSDVKVGDMVRVKGTVDEYSQVTQIKNISDLSVCSENNALPASVEIEMPVESLTQWEAIEGMRLSSNQNLVVSDLFGTGYGFGNYGQFVVSSKLHFQPTEIALPQSDDALAAAVARPLDVLLIDDGVSKAYPSFIPFPDETGFSTSNPMRIGYQVPSASGVMHAYKNNYTLIPNDIVIDPSHARTELPVTDAEADLIVVGMNVLNYFNGDGLGEGFPTSRGAPTQQAFDMQSAKIVAALKAMNADIVGLMEIENDGFGELGAISTLVNQLNAVQEEGNEYSVVVPSVDVIGTDEISVGIIYRAQKVEAIGETIVLDSANSPLDEAGEPLFIDTKNRPALIQSFKVNGNPFTIAVNHFKSKGSACGEVNEGQDGQGNCNLTRTKAALALSQFLATNPTGIETDEVMVLGDLNAYSKEDPMQIFYNSGYENLKYTDMASEEQPYSYSFSGFLGSLDHALATTEMVERVLAVDAWHINSVEAPLVDYLTEENGQLWDSIDNYAAPDAYRSSDHDPIVVSMKFEKAGSIFWLLLVASVLTRRKQA